MKISGSFIDIRPCSVASYEHSLRESGHLVGDEQVEGGTRHPHFRPGFDGQRSRVSNERSGHHTRDRSPLPNRDRGRRPSSPSRHTDSRHHCRSRSPRDRNPSRSSRDSRSSAQDGGNGMLPARQGYNSTARSSVESGNGLGNTSSIKPPQSWCIVLTGLPPRTTEKDLAHYLADVKYDKSMSQCHLVCLVEMLLLLICRCTVFVASLYIERNVHNECTGTAYVQLSSDVDEKRVLASHKEVLNQSVHVSSDTKTPNCMRTYWAE